MDIIQIFKVFIGFALLVAAGVVFSECDLPKTPRYWLRILFEKK